MHLLQIRTQATIAAIDKMSEPLQQRRRFISFAASDFRNGVSDVSNSVCREGN
jgi:hypothetical protein